MSLAVPAIWAATDSKAVQQATEPGLAMLGRRVLESIPAVSLALPSIWATTDPHVVQQASSEPGFSIAMMVASIAAGLPGDL